MSQPVFERLLPAPPVLSAFDRLSLLSYRIFKGPSERMAKAIPDLREDLLKSNLRVTPVGLISVAIFSTLIAGCVSVGIVWWASIVRFPFRYLDLIAPPTVFLLILNR